MRARIHTPARSCICAPKHCARDSAYLNNGGYQSTRAELMRFYQTCCQLGLKTTVTQAYKASSPARSPLFKLTKTHRNQTPLPSTTQHQPTKPSPAHLTKAKRSPPSSQTSLPSRSHSQPLPLPSRPLPALAMSWPSSALSKTTMHAPTPTRMILTPLRIWLRSWAERCPVRIGQKKSGRNVAILGRNALAPCLRIYFLLLLLPFPLLLPVPHGKVPPLVSSPST